MVFFVMAMSTVQVSAQVIGISTNTLGWLGATPNLGIDVGFAKKWSLELNGFYNPFDWSSGRQTHIWGLQPEVKFWPRYKFAGHYFGIHGNYAMYDWGLWKYRYKGELGGAGFSYGYAWMFHKRWNLEGSIGLGYTRLSHQNKYDRHDPMVSFGPERHNRFGLTRIALKISYFFK